MSFVSGHISLASDSWRATVACDGGGAAVESVRIHNWRPKIGAPKTGEQVLTVPLATALQVIRAWESGDAFDLFYESVVRVLRLCL